MPPGGSTPVLPAFVRVGQVQGRPGAVQQIPIEEYVLATILTEVAPANAPDPAALVRRYEVQAIVARTCAAANTGRHAAEGFDLCATTHCQLADLRRAATSSWRAQAAQAVARTLGVILLHDGRPALTVFHADCGGHTSSATDVWGGTPRPYLRGRADDLPAGAEHQTWRFEVGASALLAALNQDAVVNQIRIKITNRGGAERAYTIALEGVEGARLIAPENPVRVPAGAARSASVFVVMDREEFEDGARSAAFRIGEGAAFGKSFEYLLVGPRERDGAPGGRERPQ